MRVDCTLDEGRDLCIQFKIKGYPSILLLKHNYYYKYKGDRSAMSIIDFANDKYSQAEIQGVQIGWAFSKIGGVSVEGMDAEQLAKLIDKKASGSPPPLLRYIYISCTLPGAGKRLQRGPWKS